MIEVAEKIATRCPMLAKNLLQHAFDLAASVTPETAYKLGSGMGLQTDSRLFFLKDAYSLQEDRLSLRSRAVLAMAPLDPDLAIRLFQRIILPRLTAATCQEALIPDLSIYYKAAGKVFRLLEARKPRNPDESRAPFLLLQEIASDTASPVQLPPLVQVLENANLSEEEFTLLLDSLAATVEAFPVDDNSFYARNEYPAVQARVRMEHLARTKQVTSYAFTHSVHDFLQRSLNGTHCDGNEPKDLKELIDLYESLNYRSKPPDTEVEPLSLPTTLPPVGPHPDPGNYWVSPKAAALVVDAKHLNFDDNWKPFTDADRKTPEWRDRVDLLLNRMEEWKASDEPDPADYFHERSILLLHRTLSHLPPGPLYDRIVTSWLNTLAESSLQWDSPAEWHLEVQHFLEWSRQNDKQPTLEATIAALKGSSNAALHAYGMLAEFLK